MKSIEISNLVSIHGGLFLLPHFFLFDYLAEEEECTSFSDGCGEVSGDGGGTGGW